MAWNATLGRQLKQPVSRKTKHVSIKEPIFSLVGNYGEGQGAASILEGTFDIPGRSCQS